MESSLEAIAFLSRSPNRVRVLETLAGGNRSQPELRDEVSVSRATIARILTELEERNWIVRTGDEYELTTMGELVVGEFTPLVEFMATVQRLGDIFHLLPIDEMDFDLRRFGSAEVLVPDDAAPTRHMDRGLDLLRGADTFRVLGWTALPEYVTVVRDGLVAGDLQFECVLAASFFDRLADRPSLAVDFRDLADAGAVYRYDGRVPSNVFVADGTVFFWLCDSERGEQAALVSTDDAVRSWADRTYETYRTLAEPMDARTLVR